MPGRREDDPPAPVGEYAQSCLGRERVVEFVSRERQLRALIFRLNYAVDLRYGTLVDIARKVFAGEPIDLTMGFFNAIWQGDANSYALAQPRAVLVAAGHPQRHGPGAHLRPRDRRVVRRGLRPRRRVFVNSEGPVALLSDSSRCRALLGEPTVPLALLRQWVAHWVAGRRVVARTSRRISK